MVTPQPSTLADDRARDDSGAPDAPRRFADSQSLLALAIAEEALGSLPESASREEVEAAVDRAVRDESCRMERVLAEVRLGAAALALAYILALAVLGSPVGPRLAQLGGIVLVWAVAAFALLVALHRGGYRRWMRQFVPLADALMVGVVFGVLVGPGPVRPALIAAAGGGAVLLAFLGPTRLSRSANVASAIGAFGLWLFVSLVAEVNIGAAGAVMAMILAASYVGSRTTRGIRRLIAEQVRSVRLGKLYESAQQALDAREQVLGIVCHDLRTPLTTIGATAGLLLEIPVAEEDREHHLRVVQRVTGHMDRLIHDLLDVSRIEAGSLTVAPVPCPLQAIFEAAEEVMGPLVEAKGIALDMRAPEAPPVVVADAERIQQVLCNLIGNALKFSPDGTRIVVEATRASPKVRISVTDQGPGIPQEDMGQLWKRLWQASPGDRRGLGLGLSIAKSIVEAHHEQIGVESQIGIGSEFWFTLAEAAPPTPTLS